MPCIRQQRRADIAMFWSRISGVEGSQALSETWLHDHCIKGRWIDFSKKSARVPARFR
ncbi:hypothetical protein Hanom_Chr05g00453171 [Helianthus anomalus]